MRTNDVHFDLLWKEIGFSLDGEIFILGIEMIKWITIMSCHLHSTQLIVSNLFFTRKYWNIHDNTFFPLWILWSIRDITARAKMADVGELVKQGAEAKLFKSTFYGLPCMVKERFPKTYRHPSLDKSLTNQRVKGEVKAFLRCRMHGKFCYAHNFQSLSWVRMFLHDT